MKHKLNIPEKCPIRNKSQFVINTLNEEIGIIIGTIETKKRWVVDFYRIISLKDGEEKLWEYNVVAEYYSIIDSQNNILEYYNTNK